MRGEDWKSLEDQDFDAVLADSVAGPPPGDVVAEVTPWRRAMRYVLTGMALTALTLNFWGLDYILPAVGVILALLGFRTLRRENRWFMACCVLTAARAAYLLPMLVIHTTYLSGSLQSSPLLYGLGVVQYVLSFVLVVCLRQGFRAVQRKAQVPLHTAGATALLVWNALICLLAVAEYSGLFLGGAMIVGYIFILRSLFKLSRELDEAGYAVVAAPVRITGRVLAVSLVSVLLAGCACGYLFGGSYPMDWQPVQAGEHAGVEAIKADLIALGFPKAVLEDLTPEDIAACQGAVQVVAEVRDFPVNDGREVRTTNGSLTSISTEYDVKELRITGVAVELPGAPERWKIFHHFSWTVNPGFYGTEAIQLWPAYHLEEGWSPDGGLSGRVLYDRDGGVYAAPYHSLGSKTFTKNNVLFGEQTSTDVFAAFSLPRGGERCRGYVSYTVREARDGYIVDAWINYTHQRGWAQYPVKTAMEARMTNGWSEAGAFLTVQDALQFYPTEDGVEQIG